ncbi:HD domain-containing protein [bacterium]|nr:HD domain-containing protein [bacterium]
MGIAFSPNRFAVDLNPKIQLNNLNAVHFGNVGKTDSFESTSVEKLFNENTIKTMLNQNPNIKKLLSLYDLTVHLNMKELKELQNGHCKDTQDICMKIYNKLPLSLKSGVNVKNLKEGAMLHDFGKVLIPNEILNKNGELTKQEHEIMNLHSELGYQLLKFSGVNQEILKLVRYHHNPQKMKLPDINTEILNLADKFSALTEQRVYKKAYSPQQALTILYKEVNSGEIHPILFNSLVQAVSENKQNIPVKIS